MRSPSAKRSALRTDGAKIGSYLTTLMLASALVVVLAASLSKRSARYAPLPKGLAFEIIDLVLIKNWADLHDCRMLVRLDHGAEGEEYEEVIALYTGTNSQRHLIMWRNTAAVFLQPLIGQKQRYSSVAKALEA